MIRIASNFYIPSTRTIYHDVLQSFIETRRLNLTMLEQSYKSCLLFEGDSGVGKSSIIKQVLEKNGFAKYDASLNQSNTDRNLYYEISAGDHAATVEVLREAFCLGRVVILDELNIDPDLENVLNQYLCGVDENGKPPAHRGFMVFASQNPPSFKGRKSVSDALINRSVFHYVDPYSEDELRAIAGKVSDPVRFVLEYLRVREKNRFLNTRQFYAIRDQVLNRESGGSSLSLTSQAMFGHKRSADGVLDAADKPTNDAEHPIIPAAMAVSSASETMHSDEGSQIKRIKL